MSILRELDRPLLAMILLAVLAGIVVLYTAIAQGLLTPEGAGLGTGYLVRRLIQLALGMALMFLAALSDYRWLRRLAIPVALFACLLLVWVLATKAVRGTRGWLPILGHSFQPVDIARVALLLFMAERLAAREGERSSLRRFLWPLVALGLASGLVALQPDYGSALALGLTGAILLFVAGLPRRWLLYGALGFALLIGAAYQTSGRVRQRVDLVLQFDPGASSSEAYQLKQSLIGLGAGGPLGRGAGLGRQKGFLPDHHTDFIFAIVGEEFGLLGTIGLLCLLTAIPLRVLRISRRQVDSYAHYLAVGVAGMLFVYTVLNIAVAVGVFPVTGVPLPFISHGGSALVMNLLALGLVLGVSRDRRRPERQKLPRRARRKGEPLLEDLYGRGRG